MPSRAEEACMQTKSSATCPCQPPLVLPKTTRVGPGRSQVIQGIWGVRGRDLSGFSGGRDFFTGLMARLTEKSGPTAHQRSGRASGTPGKARANGCHLLVFGWADGAPRQARANSAPPFEGPMAHLAKPGPMAHLHFFGGLMAHLDKLGPTALHLLKGQWRTWQSQGQWLTCIFLVG